MKRFVFALSFVLVSTVATAAPFGLNDDTKLLINQMTADFVQTSSSFGTASGTVNGGVTWETDITHYLPFSSGTGPASVGSGNGSNFAPAPAANWIHAGSAFTLTFSESIAAILFRITDNDTVPGKALEASVAPTGFEGNTGVSGNVVSITGTSRTGGWVLYSGLSGNTFTSTGASGDGMNYAFAVLTTADATVPLPASVLFLIGGLGGLALLRRV